MTVSREVIIDLLPLYLSGEASPATQQLVRDALARDPALAALAQEQEQELRLPASAGAAAPNLEALSFRRTRRRVVTQRWAFGLAWLFTALTLSTQMDIVDGHLTNARLALADAPVLLGLVATAAVVSWLTYFNLRSKD